MTRTIFTLAVMALAACSKEAPPPANDVNVAETNTVQAPAAVPSLVGSWTVSQISGQAPNQVWPMTAQISADKFVLVSECRKLGYDFHQDRNVIRLTPNVAASASCGRAKSPAEIAIEKPLSLANIAMFSNEGSSVELSGPGGRIMMTRK